MPADPVIGELKSPQPHVGGTPGQRDTLVARPPHRVIGSRSLWLICGLLVATMLATGGVTIWQLRQNALNTSEREMTNLGVVLAEQTSRSFQSVDLILQEVQARVTDLGLGSPEQFHLRMGGEDTHQFLTSRLQNLPQADAISLVDANGVLVNWSRDAPAPRLDVSDRDYFRYLRDHNDPTAFISSSTEGRVTGKWIMFIVRRINGPDGAFAGLVAGLIDTTYLEDFYRTIGMVPGESVTVLRRDGLVVAGHPDISNRRGKVMPHVSPWYDRVAAGGGSYRSPNYLTSVASIITVHPVRDYPLVVDANVSEKAALKSWHQHAIGIAAATLGVALGFTALFGVIASQFRRQENYASELVRGAEMLRASERRVRDFAETSSDWFWEQDADLRFTAIGVETPLLAPGDRSHLGKRRWEMNDTSQAPERWEAHKRDVLEHRPFRDFRYGRIGPDGKQHHVSVNGVPVYNDAGQFIGYRGTGRDVTAEVEAAEQLRMSKERADAANRAKSEFLANMSHELRTPLNAIIGFSELLYNQQSAQTVDQGVAWAGDILTSSRHLLDVINNVLDLSKIEAGHYGLADDRVDFAVVVRTCLGMVRLQAEESRVRLESTIADTAAVLRADRRAVKQIVLNLLTNAVKFTPSGGLVSIRAERSTNGDLVVVVTDNGIGIDPTALKSLCEPFTQADASISRRYGGTGLGLAISRKLVALHGGALTIESALGEGTTILVTFPAERVIVMANQSATDTRISI